MLKREIDLPKMPILHWPWCVDCIYPVWMKKPKQVMITWRRIYVIHDGGWLKWRSRAINYVWSSSQPVDKAWPNAFVIQAMMVAVRSGPPAQSGQWYMQWRNVREVFKRFFDLKLDYIDAVALMTDCDTSRRKKNGVFRGASKLIAVQGLSRWCPLLCARRQFQYVVYADELSDLSPPVPC
jgi:hypothetical protein